MSLVVLLYRFLSRGGEVASIAELILLVLVHDQTLEALEQMRVAIVAGLDCLRVERLRPHHVVQHRLAIG